MDDVQSQFSRALDLACGRMIKLGREREAMAELAYELATLFGNDSYRRTPMLANSRELQRRMWAVLDEIGARPSNGWVVNELVSRLDSVLGI